MISRGMDRRKSSINDDSDTSSAEQQQLQRSASKSPQQDYQHQNQYRLKQYLVQLSPEQDSSVASRSLSTEQQPQNQHPQQLEPLGQYSSEEDSKSIDEIEERIKKLEKDLQCRIGKHKKQRVKDRVIYADPIKVKKLHVASNNYQDKSGSRPLKQINIGRVEKISARSKEIQAKILSPNRRIVEVKERQQMKMPIRVMTEKQRVQSSRNNRNQHPVGYHAQQLNRVQRKSEEQQKVIQELRDQNKRLKEQMGQYKKKKPLIEIDRLKEYTGEGRSKLQKQIQLLKIIDGLQFKLKRSIQKKLFKSKDFKPSVPLHKAVPLS